MGYIQHTFRYYPCIIGYTYTSLPCYISIVNYQVRLHNERTKSNYDRYNHLDVHSHITQIYKNMNKKSNIRLTPRHPQYLHPQYLLPPSQPHLLLLPPS